MACFTNGTKICTLKGETPVEELSVGDRVVTRDNGLQTVRRIFRRHYDYGQLSSVKHLQPILVSAGALGKELPEQDMLLSPNQRLLVSGDSVSRSVRQTDRLVAVKTLLIGTRSGNAQYWVFTTFISSLLATKWCWPMAFGLKAFTARTPPLGRKAMPSVPSCTRYSRI